MNCFNTTKPWQGNWGEPSPLIHWLDYILYIIFSLVHKLLTLLFRHGDSDRDRSLSLKNYCCYHTSITYTLHHFTNLSDLDGQNMGLPALSPRHDYRGPTTVGPPLHPGLPGAKGWGGWVNKNTKGGHELVPKWHGWSTVLLLMHHHCCALCKRQHYCITVSFH